MKRLKKIFLNLLLIISIITFCFSAYELFKIYNEYHTGKELYESLEKNIEIKKEENNEKNDNNDIILNIDFHNLKSINSDCIGWIYIPNTNINYPIIQSKNNSYCLSHNFDGNENFNGCIFVSEVNNGFEDKNTIIYGHNMQNGTMFADIKNFKSQDYLNTHPYIYIAKENGSTEKYKIFAAYTTEDCSDAYNTIFSNEDFINEINKMIQNSEVKIDKFSISDNDKIITLSTCTSRTRTERFVIHAIIN